MAHTFLCKVQGVLLPLTDAVGVEAVPHDLPEVEKRIERQEHSDEPLTALAVATPNDTERLI
eukprot:2244564-Pleurochrysis_carterae.AAC.1